MKKWNFYSGPAILPDVVIQQAAAAVHDFAGTGLSILEISHRSKEFVAVMNEARRLVRELMSLDDDKEVLFLQGGASSQFFMLPMNLLNENETASYCDTGNWAFNALTEARNFGQVHIACSSRSDNYDHIPRQLNIAPDSRYLHITTNNTIYGTQMNTGFLNRLPSGIPLLADMSSDLFSRQIDFNRFDVIYAGAQKNIGPAGVTLVVINKHLLGKVDRAIPKMLDYRVHIAKESMYNTPSVFAVYVTYLTLLWIKDKGLEALELWNRKKAAVLYAALDSSPLFEGTVKSEDRSLMNVCFRIRPDHRKAADLEQQFLDYVAERKIVGIKGYRTVGGFRASVYNAMPLEGAEALADAMKSFAQKC